MFRSMTLVFAFALLAALCPAQEQETRPEGQSTPKEASEVKPSAQQVAVDKKVGDRAIADRIQGILKATGSFVEPRVIVKSGVVFLDGRAVDESFVEWASNLAVRTENVVAVVNRLEVEEQPFWDFDPSVTELKNLARSTIRALPLIAIGLLVLGLTFLLSRWLSQMTMKALPGRVKNEILRGIIEKGIYITIVFIGVYIFLRISGLTRIAVTLIGGTGVAGIVMGFAFRDIAENFLASLLISIQRPFRLGDTIEVAGHTGIVQAVTTRGTILMDFDGNHVQVTNSTVYKSTIRNFTANPKRRVTYMVGIGYDASISEAQSVLYKVLKEHSAVLDDPAPRVLVEELGAATINLRVYAWIDGHTHGPIRVKSSLLRLSTMALLEAHISMPDEAREVVFPNGIPIISSTDSARALAAQEEKRDEKRLNSRAEQTERNSAEGSLGAEEVEIKEQAEKSQLPSQSAEVLVEEEAPRTTTDS